MTTPNTRSKNNKIKDALVDYIHVLRTMTDKNVSTSSPSRTSNYNYGNKNVFYGRTNTQNSTRTTRSNTMMNTRFNTNANNTNTMRRTNANNNNNNNNNRTKTKNNTKPTRDIVFDAPPRLFTRRI